MCCAEYLGLSASKAVVDTPCAGLQGVVPGFERRAERALGCAWQVVQLQPWQHPCLALGSNIHGSAGVCKPSIEAAGECNKSHALVAALELLCLLLQLG